MTQNNDARLVWVVFTGDGEKFRIFSQRDQALEFGETIINNFPEPTSDNWKKQSMPVGIVIQDDDKTSKLDYVWVVLTDKPLMPLAIFLDGSKAAKACPEFLTKMDVKGVGCSEFPVYPISEYKKNLFLNYFKISVNRDVYTHSSRIKLFLDQCEIKTNMNFKESSVGDLAANLDQNNDLVISEITHVGDYMGFNTIITISDFKDYLNS